tara:strand:+ start:708 stop:6215 length:5508 start_codon:yes stop_codon:yes gene_type:complete
MAINTTFYQSSPYFDDYSSSGNEEKGHLKILFKPGVPVQTRELNQLQTLLQTQVDRFGSHVFEDGSRVLDGDVTSDGNIFFIDVLFTQADLKVDSTSSPQVPAADVLTAAGLLKKIDAIIDTGSGLVGLTADVLDYEALVTTNSETKYRLYLRYTKRTQTEGIFTANQVIRSQSVITGTSVGAGTTIGTVNNVGVATKLHVDKGVYFVAGHFVNVEATDVIIERPNLDTRLTGRLAFKVSESIKTTADDSSLFDNATGVPNQSAAGADRYTISLSLVALTDQTSIRNISYNTGKVFQLTGASSTEFVSLVTLQNGKSIQPLSTKYSNAEGTLGDTLAKRTLEESGNYALDKFIIETREAYNDEVGNNGKYEATGSAITTLKAKYIVDVNPGVAYVEGKRTQIANRFSLLVDKARDTKTSETVTTSSGVGTYIEGTFTDATLPDIQADNSPFTSYVVGGTSPEKTITPTNIEKVRGTGLSTVYRLYFNLGSASYTDVNAATTIIDATVSPQAAFTPIDAKFKVRGNKITNKIVPLPRNTVNGVTTGSTTFVAKKEFSGTSGVAGDYTVNITSIASGIVILENAGSGETFPGTNPNDYIITNGVTFGTVTNVTLTNSSTKAQITMSNITSIASGEALTAIAPVKTSLSLAAKTKASATIATTSSPAVLQTGDIINLGQKDIIEITSISVDDSPTTIQTINLKDFVLDNGQRDDSYKNGTLTYIGSTTINGTVTVGFDHFTHGSGSYFSFESYPSVFDYAKIPTYKGHRLSDVFDFRGTGGASLGPNSKINTIIDYYLPRYDSLVVTRQGEFLVNKGVSELNPTPPARTRGSMVLYNLYVPPFTFNAKAIRKEYFDHRRYTMKDIGSLEKRISNLEYYTSLSLLERQAADKEIFDSAGERFKNGIFVDSFTGHNRSDVTDPKHICAIDKNMGTLRPSFSTNQVEVRVNGTSPDNYVRLPSVATKALVTQRFAAVHESVVPYAVTNYHGLISLSPSDDVWVEVKRRPNITENFDNNYDNIAFGSDSSKTLQTEWVTSCQEIVPPIDSLDSESTATWEESSGWRNFLARQTAHLKQVEPDNEKLASEVDAVKDFVSSTDIHPQFRVPRPTVKERVIIPFIRSRRVYFKATGLKPNTRHFSYIDDINITAYSTTLNGDDSPTATSFEDFKFRDLVDAQRKDFYDKTAGEAFVEAGDARRDLTTSVNGVLEGYFIIPNNTSVRFPIGKKTFVLSDTNSGVDDKSITSKAQTYYNTSGTMELIDGNDGDTRNSNPVFTKELVPDPPLKMTGNPDKTYATITPDPVPTFSLSTNDSAVIEGGAFTITLTTTNVANGTNVPYTIGGTGITSADLGGISLTGNFVVSSNTATLAITSTSDGATETSELFTIRLNNNPDVFVQVYIDDASEFVPTGYSQYNINIGSASEFCYEDPLAQSFRIGGFGIDDSPAREEKLRGCFVKSLDVYFQAKDTTLPVTVQIVEVENGTPTSRIVKNGFKSLIPSSVNVSSTDASSETTFTFDSMVYIDAEKEYAFIVRSNSPSYRLWMSEIGNVDVATGEKIDKDPYLGVAFRSSNASTWTPVQTRDIKFDLNVHTFLASTETTRTRAVGSNSSTGTNTGPFQSIIKNGPFTVTSVQFTPGQIILPKTSISYTLAIGGNTYNLNTNGTHLYLPEAVTVSAASHIALSANLTSEDEYLTPAIDFDRISLICNGNNINDVVTNETNPASGDATARYISKKVVLNDPADKLNVYIGANQPEGSRVRVYGRFDDEIGSPQVIDLKDASWVELSSASIPETTDEEVTTFTEVAYEIDPTNDFTQFQLKIVMTSDDAAQVPIINDLRAIATI